MRLLFANDNRHTTTHDPVGEPVPAPLPASAPAPVPALTRARLALEAVARSPATILCVMLLANALIHPYRGMYHDARLYGVQVSEQLAPGTFDHDLYLRYGSQDRYSIFTVVLAPLVRVAGLDLAFFLVYLASKALFFFALLRFVFRLVPEPIAALASLVYLSLAPLPFGGDEIFHLNEPFLTPRPLSCAFVLFALERALAGRFLLGLPLLVPALLLHPLMGFAGVLVVLLGWLFTLLPPRPLAALLTLGAVVGAVVVFYEPLGRRVFGHMDDTWRDVNLQLCFFINPRWWLNGDWLRLALAACVTLTAACTFARPQARFLLALLLAAALGMAGTLVAVNSHYLLLIQASPYRTIWPLELLAIPLGFRAAATLWHRGGAAGVLAFLLVLLLTADWTSEALPPAVLFLVLLPCGVVWYRGLGEAPLDAHWAARAGRATFVSSLVLMLAWNLVMFIALLVAPNNLHFDIHPVQVLLAAGAVLYKLPSLFFLLVLLCVAVPRLGVGARFCIPVLLIALGYQSVLTAATLSPRYLHRFSAFHPHADFVRDHIHSAAGNREGPLTVYWPTELGHVWFRAGFNSYYNSVQLSGSGFNRGTAIEGRRRADLAAPFEVAAIDRTPPDWWWHDALLRFYGLPAERKPTRDDLLALCADKEVDFVVLEDCFPGLYSASDERFFIYDCRALRQRALPARPPEP